MCPFNYLTILASIIKWFYKIEEAFLRSAQSGLASLARVWRPVTWQLSEIVKSPQLYLTKLKTELKIALLEINQLIINAKKHLTIFA